MLPLIPEPLWGLMLSTNDCYPGCSCEADRFEIDPPRVSRWVAEAGIEQGRQALSQLDALFAANASPLVPNGPSTGTPTGPMSATSRTQVESAIGVAFHDRQGGRDERVLRRRPRPCSRRRDRIGYSLVNAPAARAAAERAMFAG